MDKVSVITWGESGVGKTPFAGTLQECAKTSPCLFLDVDMGTLSLNVLKELPTVLLVDRWSQIAIVYDRLKKQDWGKLAEFITKETGQEVPVLQYKSVVIDSGTELEYKLRSGVVIPGNEKGDPDKEIASQPDYLRTQERFRKMYRVFRDLPITLVMTAGVRELKEESTGILKRYPDFQPGLARDLVRMTDLVLYMSVTASGVGAEAKGERHLITSLSQRFVARDRSGKLPAMITAEKFYFKDLLGKVLS